MLTRQDLIDYCLSFPCAYEDYPFDDDPAAPGAWTVMRHRLNKKAFAFLFERMGNVCVNVKCDPMYADLLRGVYPAVIPAYHMNKTHWNSIIMDGSIPDSEVRTWISQSYELIRPKQKINV